MIDAATSGSGTRGNEHWKFTRSDPMRAYAAPTGKPARVPEAASRLALRAKPLSPILVYMEYSPKIPEMLGTSRFTRIEQRLAAIGACVASVPDRTSWVKHLPIPLGGSDPVVAHDELVDRLRK